jgi:hypothetical protein
MDPINPKVVDEMEEQWHKIAAILMFHFGVKRVDITSAEIERFIQSGPVNIAIRPKGETLTLMLLNEAETNQMIERGGME